MHIFLLIPPKKEARLFYIQEKPKFLFYIQLVLYSQQLLKGIIVSVTFLSYFLSRGKKYIAYISENSLQMIDNDYIFSHCNITNKLCTLQYRCIRLPYQKSFTSKNQNEIYSWQYGIHRFDQIDVYKYAKENIRSYSV